MKGSCPAPANISTKAPRWRNIVNILTAAVSFIFVLGYLLTSAIPKYNSAVWETAIDVSARLPVPAIAMVVAQVEGRPSQARFSETVVNGTAVDLPGVVVSYSPEGDVQVWTEPPALRRERLDLELAGEVMAVDGKLFCRPNSTRPPYEVNCGRQSVPPRHRAVRSSSPTQLFHQVSALTIILSSHYSKLQHPPTKHEQSSPSHCGRRISLTM